MKKFVFILTMAAALLSASCTKELSAPGSDNSPANIVELTIHATKEFHTGDPEVKATYDPETNLFGFEEGDKLRLLIAKVTGSTINSQKRVTLDMKPGTEGTFSGNVDLTDYSLTDIRGAVLVREGCPDNAYVIAVDNSNICVSYSYLQSQTQAEAGKFSDASGRYMLYAPITSSMLSRTGDGQAEINGLKLRLITPLWEYRVYGADRTGEKIVSVKVTINKETAAQSMALTDHKIKASSAAHYKVNTGSCKYSGTVSLETPCQVPADNNSAASAPIWHAVYGRDSGGATAKTLKTITVTTDKAAYTRNFAGSVSQKAWLGYIHPININIGSDGGFSRDGIQFSTDGGATWGDSLPAEGTAYTDLSVRSESGVFKLDAATLTEIRNWIETQSGTVSLDLSGIKYESVTFPAVFGNATAANASKKLGAITFPSNVTTLAKGAFRYCTGLTAVDFSNITSISTAGTDCYTFQGCTGLTTIDLPVIKTMGRYTFANCLNVTSITLGASCTAIGGRAFDSCVKLSDLYVNARLAPSRNGDTNFLNKAGTSAEHKYIHVPSGSIAEYSASSYWKSTGYTLVGETDPAESQTFYITDAYSTGMHYSTGRPYSTSSVIQSFDLDTETGDIYYSQLNNNFRGYISYGTRNSSVQPPRMTLNYFGHVSNFSLEVASDGSRYIWIDNFSSKNSSGEYWGSPVVSRVKYVSGTTLNAWETVENYYFGVKNLSCAVDVEGDMITILGINSGNCTTYRLSELQALPVDDITLNEVTYGGESASGISETTTAHTIKARDCTGVTPLGTFYIPREKYADDTTVSWQGFDIKGGLVYQAQGNAHSSGTPSSAWLQVRGIDGSTVVPLTPIKAIEDLSVLDSAGITDTGYMEAEGVKVHGDYVYIGFASKNSSNVRHAVIFRYSKDVVKPGE